MWNNILTEIENAYFKENNVNKEVELFINELFDEVINTSDFSLVDRSHEDKVWQNTHVYFLLLKSRFKSITVYTLILQLSDY